MVIVATGRYIGEGFDFALLDTMFIAMPVLWRGTLAQSAGRLHRLEEFPVKGFRVLDPGGPHRGPCNKRWSIQENLPGKVSQ